MRTNLRDAQQAALGFLMSQTTHIEAQAYEVRYPDIQYQQLIPVDTSAPEWSSSVTFFSEDKVGAAEWFHANALDVPIADVTREKFEQGIEMAAIGYRYTLEELGKAMMIPGRNLSSAKAAAARRAYEEMIDDIALRGNTAKGWTGLINSGSVTTVLALADGNGDTTDWENKTADQVLRDVNGILTGVYTASLTVEMADTILLPIASMAALATRRLDSTSSMTILQFLQTNNVYSMITGQKLTIRGVRGLESAGAGGTGRMVAYRRDPAVLKLHIPMTHRFLPVWQRGAMMFDVPGIFRLGGLEIRRPGAVRYIDGILGAAYE